jgi:hypothetical protein
MAGLNETQRQAAMAAGRFAGERQQPITTCPYPVGGTPTQRALANVWMREYLRANPEAAQAVSTDG